MFFKNLILNLDEVEHMKILKHEEIHAFYFKKIQGEIKLIDNIIFGIGDKYTIKDIRYNIALGMYKYIDACGMVIVHNHPKVPLVFDKRVKASKNDIKFTNQFLDICKKNNISFLDHIIVSKDGYFSFLENGLIKINISESY